MRITSTTLQGFAFGLVMGYVAGAFHVTSDPRSFITRLRAQLMREEGVSASDSAPARTEG